MVGMLMEAKFDPSKCLDASELIAPTIALQRPVYAVRRGHHVGVYDDFDQCKLETQGHYDPVYKKFHYMEMAQAFVDQPVQLLYNYPPSLDDPVKCMWVKGLRDSLTGCSSYALCYKDGTCIVKRCREVRSQDEIDLVAVIAAIRRVLTLHSPIPDLGLFYDVDGSFSFLQLQTDSAYVVNGVEEDLPFLDQDESIPRKVFANLGAWKYLRSLLREAAESGLRVHFLLIPVKADVVRYRQVTALARQAFLTDGDAPSLHKLILQ